MAFRFLKLTGGTIASTPLSVCRKQGIQSIRVAKPQAAYSTSVTKGDGPQGAMNHTTPSLAPLTGYAKIRQTIHENRLRITDQHVKYDEQGLVSWWCTGFDKLALRSLIVALALLTAFMMTTTIEKRFGRRKK